jgi:Baseplate J-like protein
VVRFGGGGEKKEPPLPLSASEASRKTLLCDSKKIKKTMCTHPYQHTGTSQNTRLLRALMPENIQLDNRKLEDLMVFANRFAQQIRYWNDKDQVQGDWTCFWQADALFFLADVAASDTEGVEKKYRTAERDLVNASTTAISDAHVQVLINIIYDLAWDIEKWGERADNHPIFKGDVANLIKNRLQTKLCELIAYDKNYPDDRDYKPFTYDRSTHPFAQVWNLNHRDFTQIDYKELPDDMPVSRAVESLRVSLRKIFQAFADARKRLEINAEGYLRAIQSDPNRGNHQPHIALFLAFLQMFRHLQDQMNTLTAAHLDYFYRDILQLQQRAEIPDHAHLVFQLARGVHQYQLDKGTILRGGKTADGRDKFYVLDRPLVLNQSLISEVKTLYAKHENNALTLTSEFEVNNAEKMKTVKPFLPFGALDDTGEGLSEVGFAIASPEIESAVANRTVRLSVQMSGLTSDLIEKLSNNIKVEISHTKGWLNLDKTVSTGNFVGAEQDFRVIAITKTNNNVNSIVGFQMNIRVGKKHPVFAPPPTNIKNPINFDARFPILKITLTKNDVTTYKELYTALSTTFISDVTIGLLVQNLTQFDLQDANGRSLGATQSVNIGLGGHPVLYIKGNQIFQKTLKNKPVMAGMLAASAVDPFAIPFSLGTTLPDATTYQYLRTDGTWSDASSTVEMDYTRDLKASYDRAIRINLPKAEHKTPIFTDVSLNYASETSLNLSDTDEGGDQFFLITSHNGHQKQDFFNQIVPRFEEPFEPSSDGKFMFNSENTRSLNPPDTTSQPNGNLFIGIKNAVAGQVMSLYFQTVPDTESNNSAHTPDIDWAYLTKDGTWHRFPLANVLFDSTKSDPLSKRSLVQSGVVELLLPDDKEYLGSTLLNPKLTWIRAVANEELPKTSVAALPNLAGIFANGTAVTLATPNVGDAHFDKPLIANTISQLKLRQAAVRLVEQPYEGFGGQVAERGNPYYRRAAEHLRHRNRAVTAWDYEHLVLEAFPDLRFAKSVNHTEGGNIHAAGHVTLLVVPQKTLKPLQPPISQAKRDAIVAFLEARTSPFLKNKIHIETPQYQAIQIKIEVKFREGDTEKMKHDLDQALTKMLAPWAFDNSLPIPVGQKIYRSDIIAQIEALPYVDFIGKLTANLDATSVIDKDDFVPKTNGVLTAYQDPNKTPFSTNHLINIIEP